jgi:hypothetical protein
MVEAKKSHSIPGSPSMKNQGLILYWTSPFLFVQGMPPAITWKLKNSPSEDLSILARSPKNVANLF